MKFKNSVSSLKPKKRTLLIVTASCLILVLFGTSVALYQRHQENVSKAHAATLATEAKAEQARTARENATKAQLTQSETYRHQLCDLLAQKAKTKPTAGYIVVPVVACTF
jgi:sensor c-di-GMP phosphodiesterase-like protein